MNTSFDPLRKDPFTTSTRVDRPHSIVSSGHEHKTTGQQKVESADDVLLQFANSNAPPSPSKSKHVEGDDVRATRKERVMLHSPRSVLSPSSHSSRSTYSYGNININTIAPPPEFPVIRDYSSSLFHVTSEPNPESKPLYELISHSGTCMARISIRTKLLKLWKSVFWIVYDDRYFFVFKTKNIFEEWLMNPYLSKGERMALVKLKIDFHAGPSTFGYQVSYIKPKIYRKSGLVYQFKLDMWDYTAGPSILAAFGSLEPSDVTELRLILKKLLEDSPMNADRMGVANLHDLHSDSMSERSGVSYYSNGESVHTAPYFARPQDKMISSTRSV